MSHRKIEITSKLLERFWKFVDKTNDCWVWTGYKNRQGYGRFGLKASQCVNASRVSWTIENGDIPDNYFVCHKCDNPSCVKPDHLFAGTRQDNIDDMVVKKRSRHFHKNEYYGVIWEERLHEGQHRKGRWRSFICLDGKIKKLSSHTSVVEAARNYDRIAFMKYGIKDKLNFPEEYKMDNSKR